LFVYDFKDKESQRIQETMFEEKRTLIENCLFGVDINPKSVYICRLRLWIELLKNAYYRSETLNTKAIPQLETLPNIDINIKCGNSLVSFFNLNGNGFSKTQMKNIQGFTKEYKKQVSLYKDITDKTAKEKIVKNIKMLKNTFMDYANPNDKDYKELKKKEGEHGATPIFFNRNDQIEWNTKQEKLYKEITVLEKIVAEKQRSLYAKAFEWRFEFPEVLDDNGYFVGFDAVVGNPPYYSLQFSKFNFKAIKEFYNTYEQTGDICSLFIERAVQILKHNGSLSFIVSNRFCNTEYGASTRKFLGSKHINNLIDINDSDVFEMANVGTLIFNIYNKDAKDDNDIKLYKVKDVSEFSENKVIPLKLLCTSKQKFFKENHWIFRNSETLAIKQKMESNGVPLSQTKEIKTYRGVTTGQNEIFIIDEDRKNELISKHKSSEEIIKPLLRGGNIKKFFITEPTEWIIFTRRGIDIKKYPAIENYLKKYKDKLEPGIGRKKGSYKWYEIQDNTAYYKEFEKEKIVWGQISSKNHFAISTENEYSLNSTFIATGNDLKFYCAVLNSKAVLFYVRLGAVIWGKDGIKWLGDYFFNTPIANATKNEKAKISEIVDKILEKKKENLDADIKNFEKQIDREVYSLYNLTKEEIKIIENETT